MAGNYPFGNMVQRRMALELTRAQLADREGSATETIKKIERDEHRPSRQAAVIFVNTPGVPPEEQALLQKAARG